MGLFWKNKALLVKSEATYGVDPVPTAGANGMLVQNLSVVPMKGQDVSRELDRAFFGAQQLFPVGLYVELSFDVELAGHATRGTAPGWGPIAKACGMSEVASAGTSVVYLPVSSGLSSATCYFHVGGTRQIITGCRGTAVLKLNANSLPKMSVKLTGLYQEPTDTAGVSPTVTQFQQPLPVTKANTATFTINGVNAVMRSFEFDLARQVEPRLLVGLEEIVIVDSAETITTQIEATAMAAINPFALAKNQTSFAVNLVHGAGSGKIVTINAPTCTLNRPESYANTQNIWEWPLKIMALPSAGNDQFTITLT